MPTQQVQKIRLSDIARRVGVSTMAVSQALNPRNVNVRISAAKAENIRKIAAEMNYRPNLIARQLNKKSSNMIGVIIDSGAWRYQSEALKAMERWAAQYGYRVIVGFLHDSLDQIDMYIDDFVGRGIEGVICIAHTYPEFGAKVPGLLKCIPHRVFIDKPLGDTDENYVTLDWEDGAYQMTGHLHRLSHQRIVCAIHSFGYQTVLEQKKGYEKYIREFGLAPELLECSRQELHINSFESANACLDRILPYRPDAIITAMDDMAMFLIGALSDRGLRVPHDIAVVSMGNMPLSAAFRPAITAANNGSIELIQAALNVFFEEMEGKDNPSRKKKHLVLKQQLIIGESCGYKLNS